MDGHLVNTLRNKGKINDPELNLVDMGCNEDLLSLSATQVSVFQSLQVAKVEVLPGLTKK